MEFMGFCGGGGGDDYVEGYHDRGEGGGVK